MRREYNQEIACHILGYSPEQTGYRDLLHVGPYHEINDEREGQKVCGMIKIGIPSIIDEGREVPHRM